MPSTDRSKTMSPISDLLLIFDPNLLLKNCGGDEELAEEILQLFRQQVGVARGDLPGADTSERAMIAHGLKGSARTCGASELAEAAARLEREPGNGTAADDLAFALADLAAALADRVAADGAVDLTR